MFRFLGTSKKSITTSVSQPFHNLFRSWQGNTTPAGARYARACDLANFVILVFASQKLRALLIQKPRSLRRLGVPTAASAFAVVWIAPRCPLCVFPKTTPVSLFVCVCTIMAFSGGSRAARSRRRAVSRHECRSRALSSVSRIGSPLPSSRNGVRSEGVNLTRLPCDRSHPPKNARVCVCAFGVRVSLPHACTSVGTPCGGCAARLCKLSGGARVLYCSSLLLGLFIVPHAPPK